MGNKGMAYLDHILYTRNRLQTVLNKDIKKADDLRKHYIELYGKTDERSIELRKYCISDMRCLRRQHEKRLELLADMLRILKQFGL